MASKWINLSDADRQEIIQALGPDNPLSKKLIKAGKKITTASAKAKGRDLQQWMCEKVSDLTQIAYDQQDDSCLIHSREMGQPGVDVILRGPAQKAFPFAIECKSTESLNLTEAVNQCQANTKPGLGWMVVHRSKRLREPIIITDWDGVLSLIRLADDLPHGV